MEARKHQMKSFSMVRPQLLARTKPWEPRCISGVFWPIEQGEKGWSELSRKVGLHRPPNGLPKGFAFLGFTVRN